MEKSENPWAEIKVKGLCLHPQATCTFPHTHRTSPYFTRLTDALSTGVQTEAHVAFTAVAPRCWNTAPVQTEIEIQLTHAGEVLGGDDCGREKQKQACHSDPTS